MRTDVRIAVLARQIPLFATAAEPTVLVGERGRVTYVPEFLAAPAADELLADLRAGTTFHADSRMMYGKRVLVPRETASRGDGADQPWTPALLTVRARIEAHCGVGFDYVFINRYRNGHDAVAWHGDHDGGGDPTLVVASLSLGATRAFDIRPHPKGPLRYHPLSVDVAHGDLIVMSGEFHRFWQHRVRRDPRVADERINLTFRQRGAERRIGLPHAAR